MTFPLSRPGVYAGLFIVFIPVVGEFVIPDLLGGANTLLIGKTLWNEFFTIHDWPVASACGVILIVVLRFPTFVFETRFRKQRDARS
ncbi:MAG: ABC transporter permease subunit [Hyphomicrobium sp.]